MELRRAHEQQLTELYAEIGKLSTKARLAEKKVTTLSREERVALVERAQGELPLSQQADLLSLSRASFYYQPRPPSAAEVQLKHCIDAHLHAVSLLRFPEDCSTVTAGRDGHQSENRGAVYERDGHRGHLPGAESEQAQSERRSVSVRDSRHITSAYPNHIRVIDITYIRLHAGSCCRRRTYREVRMAKGELWTIFLRSGSGAPSSMKKFTCTTMRHHARPGRP